MRGSTSVTQWIAHDRNDAERRRLQLREFLASPEARKVLGDPNDGPVSALEFLPDAMRDNTNRAYTSDRRHYKAACLAIGEDPLAPSRDFWIDYFETLAETPLPNGHLRRASSTIRSAFAIGRMFFEHGLPSPTRTFVHRQLMRSIARSDMRVTKKAKPLWGDTARKLIDSYDRRTLRGCRDRAIAALGINRGFRSATIVQLKLQDITFDPRGVVIGISGDKTSVSGEITYTATPHTKRHITCAACILGEHLSQMAARGIVDGPAFRAISRWGEIRRTALTTQSVSDLLRKGLRQAGVLEADSYSSHSYRHGVVRMGLAKGWSIDAIRLVTLHRSLRGIRAYIEAVDPWVFAPSSLPLDDGEARSTSGDAWCHEPK